VLGSRDLVSDAAPDITEQDSAAAATEPLRPAAPAGRKLAGVAAVEVVGFGVSQLLRLGSNLVLARLLFPEAFGLMAMLSLVLYGVIMLTDVGLSQAVIRSEHGEDPIFLDTAWSIQVTRGLILWVIASAVAWPASLIFREPALLWMIPAGTASAAIQGFGSTRILTLRRHLRPAPVVALELSTQLAGILIMIALAAGGLGVWSLVVGNLVMAAAHTGFSYVLPGTHRERFRIDPGARKEIIHFGRWIYASSAVTFLAGRGDQVVLGRLLGAASLGLFNVGLNLAEAPEALANRVIGSILYPYYARLHNESPADFPAAYYRTRLAFDGVVHTALGGLMALSPWLIRVLYDQRYLGAIPMLQILALRTSVSLVASPCETALTAQGHSIYGFRRNLFVAISTLVLMPAGYALDGATGLLLATAVARATALAAIWPAAWERGILRLRRELLVPAFLALGFGVGSALIRILPGR
jgi:O-antigen/teichoic acid export membrane protein